MKLKAPDGKMRFTDLADTEQIKIFLYYHSNDVFRCGNSIMNRIMKHCEKNGYGFSGIQGKMKKFFSINSATEKATLLLKRFPISILLIIGFACCCFYAKA
ncbi:MAG: hypothetical protein LBU89_12785, partial [Fibromonadaceae bacterium]|nr:hypothetical protein [Fibromonadaceae bacterium]